MIYSPTYEERPQFVSHASTFQFSRIYSEFEDGLFRKVVKAPDETIVSKLYKVDLLKSKINCLGFDADGIYAAPCGNAVTQWLNDEIVNIYFQILNSLAERNNLNYCFFSTHFLQKLLEDDEFAFENVER